MRFQHNEYNNGFGLLKDDRGVLQETPGELDKSMHSWTRRSEFSDKSFSAYIGNSFSNGNRGMAKSVKWAKKFIRSRIRFHENARLSEIKKSFE